MTINLTEYEHIILLGILEDLAQEDDVKDAYSENAQESIRSIIRKLGGTYYGKLK